MTTLADLWTSLFPAAVAVAPLDAAARAREVGWVRVLRARVPAFDGLDPDDLAIVPAGALESVAPGPAEARALVAEFVRARVAGLLLVEGDPTATAAGAAGALEALGAQAVEAALPVLRAARLDPGAVERSAIGFIVNRRAELDRQAARLEARLEALALAGSDLAGLLGAIGQALERAVALEGRRGHVLAVHAPADIPGAAAVVGAYLAHPRSAALRVALPPLPGPGVGQQRAANGSSGGSAPSTDPAHSGPASGGDPVRGGPATGGPAAGGTPRRAAHSSGSLVLLGDRPISDLERVVAERIAALLALELARDESVRRARDATRRGEALPGHGPPWVVLLADQVGPGTSDTIERREEARRELRLLATARRMTLRGDAASLELRIVLAAGTDDPGGLDLATRIARFLDRPVALSRPFADPTDRPTAEADARATLEAARGLADPPVVARADRLAAYRLLGGLHNLPDGGRQARALLEPLLAGRPDVRVERLATLRATLDHPGPGEAAAVLGVHRNTIAYRIRRMEAATGWSLQDPDLRLALSVALRVVQTAQD